MNQNKFSTFDLGLATVLTTLGYKLLELDRSNPRKVMFSFEKSKATDRDIADYWNNKTKLPALTLFNNQKTLKNRIYSNA